MTFQEHYEDLIDSVTSLRLQGALPADVATIVAEGQTAKDAMTLAADIDEARGIAEAYAISVQS